ncbi:hypothetical protein ES332_A10G242700v1 [Gossypium tomentosum]|uniref:Uncharacterized protein n=1 Tax=Gossypium tomentosum TaxID=34277 RepID=A0A5D2NU80_GOSTO|nr:hypothetical protein ES332_A10G242700v1 [Gossypium tomentosum]
MQMTKVVKLLLQFFFQGEITSLKGFEAIEKQPEPSLFALEPASAYHSTDHSTL